MGICIHLYTEFRVGWGVRALNMDFSVVADFVGLAGSLGTVAIAVVVFRWSRRAASLDANRLVQNEWQAVNIAVASNENLVVHDFNFHPFGDISRSEHYKLLLYFMHLNTSFNVWKSFCNGLVERDLAMAVLNNQANLLYDDRSFVEVHALTRGYTADFKGELLLRWKEISRLDGMRLPMDFDPG